MHDTISPLRTPRVPHYDGLRATAEEYFALPDDEFRYELIDGVILMSPSPTTNHQHVAAQIFLQLSSFLQNSPVGMVFYEIDIRFSANLVYRPEIVFVRKENLPRAVPRIDFAPDAIVEVVSPESRASAAVPGFSLDLAAVRRSFRVLS